MAEAWGVDVEDLDDTAFADGTKGGDVKQLTEVVQAVIDVKDGNVFDFRGLNLNGADQIQFDASIFADFADMLAAGITKAAERAGLAPARFALAHASCASGGVFVERTRRPA